MLSPAHSALSTLNSALRLHLGSGKTHIPGWINIDNQPLPGVDRVLDVTHGLPFEEVQFIFAEHFIEHIPHVDALVLLRECRRVLRDLLER